MVCLTHMSELGLSVQTKRGISVLSGAKVQGAPTMLRKLSPHSGLISHLFLMYQKELLLIQKKLVAIHYNVSLRVLKSLGKINSLVKVRIMFVLLAN